MLDLKIVMIKNHDKVCYVRKVNPILILYTTTLVSYIVPILVTNETSW